jgi:hypothetical protein
VETAAPAASSSATPGGAAKPAHTGRRVRRWRWIAGILFLIVIGAIVCIRVVIDRAEPILRTRVIETLATRFESRVELAGLHVSVTDGLEVSGGGLQIYGPTDPNPYEPGVQPLLEIREFRFHTALRNLFREPMRVETVYVSGLVMNIPPREDRAPVRNLRRRGKMSIAVDRFVCEDTKLIINTLRPGKLPLEFDISNLTLKDIGPGLPFRFDATLVNPKPTGDVHSVGRFGPLAEASPRDTAVEGEYAFTDADLSTLKGIAGILSSTGKYGGTLGRIEVTGETDTPDFRLAVSGHPVRLHSEFHAIVDGTDGDTYLDPVNAQLLHSAFTAKGKIVRSIQPPGHNIELDVILHHAHIEDLLTLGVKTDPPVMRGAVEMKSKFRLAAGSGDLIQRLKLSGDFNAPASLFSNERVQDRIDSLSLRSQGHAKLAREQNPPDVPSAVKGIFALDQAVLSFSAVHFAIPGSEADMTGQYSLDGNTFDFHGTIRLDAKLSQMTTGWKSILLKPVDPFFHKNGAGTQLPFKITGTRSEPKFGLDFHHEDDSKGSEKAAHAK